MKEPIIFMKRNSRQQIQLQQDKTYKNESDYL